MQPETTLVTKADLDAFEQRMTAKLSEVLEEFYRARRIALVQQSFARLDDDRQSQNANPNGYTQDDVPRLVKEARREIKAEHEAGPDAL